MRGYDTSFRLVACQGDKAVLYETAYSDRAKVGADLFDIGGRVERTSFNRLSDASPGTARIDDPMAVDELVSMLLAAPIVSQAPDTAVDNDDLTAFRLKDGTHVEFLIGANGRLILDRDEIALPPAFIAKVDHATATQDANTYMPEADGRSRDVVVVPSRTRPLPTSSIDTP